jgi:photosystem II stability/assembly factor-like uncharacterized protein
MAYRTPGLLNGKQTGSTNVMKIKRIIAAMALWVCLISEANAQVPHVWRTINLHPENGKLNSVELSSNGWAVAVGEAGLIEFSSDTGATWVREPLDVSPTLNGVTFARPSQIVAVGDSGLVLRSSNGIDWTQSRIDPTEKLTAVSSDRQGNLCVVSSSGAVRLSTDAGVSWTLRAKFDRPLLCVRAVSPQYVFGAGTQGLVIHSIDGGLHWISDSIANVDFAHASYISPAIWFVAGQKWSLFQTLDAGRSWQRIVIEADTVGASLAEIHDLGFFANGNGVAFVRDDSKGYFDQYLTTNGGQSWKNQNDASFGGATDFATSVGVTSIISGPNGGLKRTTNSGRFWRKVDSVADQNHDVLAFANQSVGVTCSTSGIDLSFYLTTDGGLSWAKTKKINTLRRPKSISFPDPTLCIAAGDSGSIFRSADGGMSWSQSALKDSGFIGALRMYDARHGILYTGGPNTIQRTTDGGVTWIPIASPIVSDQLGIYAFTYFTARVVLALGTDSHTYRSEDSGKTWRLYGMLPFQADHLSFPDSLHGWATSEQDIVMMTTDGGINWTTQLDKSADGLLDLAFLNSSRGIAAGYASTIFETTNGGAAWQQIFDTAIYEGLGIVAVQFPSADYAVLLTGNGLVIRAEYTQSGVSLSNERSSGPYIFPNPAIAGGRIRIEATTMQPSFVKVVNALGQAIPIQWRGESERAIDLQLAPSMAPGIYFMTVSDKTSSRTIKVVITK